MSNMFTSATILKTSKPKKAATKEEIVLAGLEKLAALATVQKSIDAMKSMYETEVKHAMGEHFVEAGCAIHKRPENFRGVEGGASASCELRIRASSSGLTVTELLLTEQHGIPTEQNVSVAETFVINPAYLGDGALLERIGAILGSIKDVPEDFIKKQEGQSKTVVSANALDVMFSKNMSVARELLPIIGVLAIKPKFDDAGLAYEIVQKLISPVSEEA